jgi:hypothetical protein
MIDEVGASDAWSLPMTALLIHRLAAVVLGEAAAGALLDTLAIDPALAVAGASVDRGVFSMALNAVLFDDLLRRAPTGAAYVADIRRAGGKVTFDHGAVRTVRFAAGGTGALPPGKDAFVRLLRPLGYRLAEVYPLERLKMTGWAYVHADLPETIPQFFVSELHVGRFPAEFQTIAEKVFGATREPLGDAATAALEQFSAGGTCPFDLAAAALPEIAGAFGRWHPEPTLDEYEQLLAHSAEAAWIATEGQAFNHATDRVADVDALAEEQRRLGRSVKDLVEISRHGTVRQTAFRADPVERMFRTPEGPVRREVPGSFYEFISRDFVTGSEGRRQLDLRFDSGNAQGIFKMTAAG